MQGMIRKTFVLFIAAMVVTAGFGLTLDPVSAATGPTSITIKAASGTGTSAVVDISGKVKVYVSSVYPSTRSKSVTWSVYSGSAYGKISSKSSTYCYVQGIKTGTVVIKAKSNYYPYATKYIKIYVKQLYPTGVTLSRTSLNMWAGTGYNLTATVVKKPWVYSAGVTWKTNSSSIATVGTTGRVTSVASGTTTITATSKDKTTLKALCTVKVFKAAMTIPGRVNLTLGGSDIDNPVVVSGPSPSFSTVYTSSNNAAVTVSSAGTLRAVSEGSSTITATVTMPSITSTTKTKVLTYVVNVKKPVGTAGESFTFGNDYAKLELIHDSHGFTGSKALLFNKSLLDDLFGFGSLGIDLWNPMDMHENFFATDMAWHAGGFTFDKVGLDVEVSAMINQNTWSAPYVLNNTDSEDCSMVMMEGMGGNFTGYDLKFYYTTTPADGHDLVTLRGDVLTIPFGSDYLAIERISYNKVQIMDDVDGDTVFDDVVLTITRNEDGFEIDINDQDYMTDKGISFNLYKTYL